MAMILKMKRSFWVMTLLTFVAIALFLRLGYWQLQRADEKKQMIAALNTFAHTPPIAWSPHDALPRQYQPMALRGHFLPEVFLLDNQHYQHQFGYDVVSALLLANDRVILVDRGWIKGASSRSEFPTVDIPAGQTQLVGTAYYPSEKNWVLGQPLEKKQAHFAVIERLDTALISQFLHKSVYPFIIRLEKQDPRGYVREWSVVAMPPARHYGYAVQWFSISLLILIIYISLNAKKIRLKKNT